MAHHEITPSGKTVHWGYFDATLAPVVTIEPGDTISLHSISGGPDDLPPEESGFTVPAEHREALAAITRGPGPHLLTGPIAVAGAEPGDALRVEILDVKLRNDWGYMRIRPLAGALPDDFHEASLVHIAVDRGRNLARMAWGLEIPAAPFFGVMGTAPPPNWGRQTSIVPRAFGGNIDNKELTAGSVLMLPVFVAGGLFSAGDGHAMQGDGEVCLTAVETGLTGTFRIGLVKGANLPLPRAETPTHLITMGFDEDLDDAARTALREMIALIVRRSNLSREDAYRLCSLVVDLHVTQLVNQNKGVHAMLPRWALGSG